MTSKLCYGYLTKKVHDIRVYGVEIARRDPEITPAFGKPFKRQVPSATLFKGGHFSLFMNL